MNSPSRIVIAEDGQLDRKLLVFVTAAFAGLGLLMVYSSSVTARPSFSDQRYLTRQLIFLGVGVLAASAAATLPRRFWRQAAVPLFAVSVLLLIAVLIPGVGARVNGAQRWIRWGPVSVQPSEIAKISLVLLLAWGMERQGDRGARLWRRWLPWLVPAALVSALVLVEPDFGTAVFLVVVALVVLFSAGVPLWHLLVLAAGAVPVFGVLVLTQPYRVKRLFDFAAGWSDPAHAPYQVQQSLLALGSGGLWGVGLGKGWQKLGFLPEANTDFVFAVIGEELGLAGTLAVLGLWCTYLICGVRLARGVRADRFAFLVVFGLVSQSALQALINIGVVTGSLPPKGISLPFLSAGGSNLIISLVSVGIVLGLTRGEAEVRSESERQGGNLLARHRMLVRRERQGQYAK